MNARRILADVGLILLCVVATLALEQVVVGFVARRFFVAAWEYAVIRKLVSPLALALFVPASLGLACIMQLLHSARIRATLPAVQAGAAGVLMLALTTSHRFERVLVRAAVVLLFAAAVGLAARVVLPRLERAPVRVQRGLAAAGIALAWTADAFVLVRLYPPFHLAWFLILLACTAWLAATLRAPSMDRVGYVASAAALMSCAWAWRSRGRVFVYDNVVLVLSERAPLHGRAVAIAALLAPPGDIVTPDVGTPATPIPARRQRNIDWAGHDILLVSIDALRADHVSAYGYARKTTPHIDALAAQGVRFDHAYCPTPHTSYSVTSMMTGKYMRPLLLMGMGQDSETWPQVLRRYDYKTAAFYPPAVFFIDEDKFRAFSESALGFEYKKEEFADPDLRVQQMESYLATAPPQTPLFAWVHLFEPHEPYEAHAGFHFEGSTDLDAYDGEVAFADAAVGRIVDVMKKRARPLVVIVTADHGEEFGDHGGRYHGTTVYEEQVRVPLIIVAPKLAPRVVAAPVQTIDLLATVLSALDIPEPPKLRGQDLGPLLAGHADASPLGLAFAETHDMSMLAEGSLRLVCRRKLASCNLYDVAKDPHELQDMGATDPTRLAQLKVKLARIERAHGAFERPGSEWPEALRRGIAGERDAAVEVASLLDDASPKIRAKAAEITFALHDASAAATVRRAAERESDVRTKTLAMLALVRMNEELLDTARAVLGSSDEDLRARAALVLAERKDPSGARDLVAAIRARSADFEACVQYIEAAGVAKLHEAVPALVPLLADVRLRGYAAAALGEIGDAAAVPPLLAAFKEERYATARIHEARALSALGASEDMLPTLRFFAGVPDPLYDAVRIADARQWLRPERGGFSVDEKRTRDAGSAAPETRTLVVPEGPTRALVLASRQSEPTLVVDGQPLTLVAHGTPSETEGGGVYDATFTAPGAGHVRVEARGARAVWLVSRVADLPPPKRP